MPLVLKVGYYEAGKFLSLVLHSFDHDLNSPEHRMSHGYYYINTSAHKADPFKIIIKSSEQLCLNFFFPIGTRTMYCI